MSIFDETPYRFFENSMSDEQFVIVSLTQRKMNRGDVDINMMSWFGQNNGNQYTTEDAFYFNILYNMFYSGQIYVKNIFIGQGALPDKEKDKINNILKQKSQKDGWWIGEFVGGYGIGDFNNDGYVKLINHPLRFDTFTPDQQKHEMFPIYKNYSLEVGNNTFAKTYGILTTEGCIARWPYGYPSIMLFSLKDNNKR